MPSRTASEHERSLANTAPKPDTSSFQGFTDIDAKLSNGFEVPALLGNYIPDQAVLVTTPDGESRYSSWKPNSTAFLSGLRNKERDKIKCR